MGWILRSHVLAKTGASIFAVIHTLYTHREYFCCDSLPILKILFTYIRIAKIVLNRNLMISIPCPRLEVFHQSLRVAEDTGVVSSIDHKMYGLSRPPETILSPASDLWQVGLTLYRLLSGADHNQMADLAKARERIRDRLPPLYHCPISLWKVLRKLLAPKPEERQADCTEALAALSRVSKLLNWRQTVRQGSVWEWEAPLTLEKLTLSESSGHFDVEYTKNGRRALSICPPGRPGNLQEALNKVEQCFRRLENQ
jgi:serine/threonine protein kinase